ncbi:LysR family transcriptional regulator [Candidatus Thorarchaeota archaeon]|nr:MAG: LysR family transcriptional regulator [Candidatus Thorarchaeota archaeon]
MKGKDVVRRLAPNWKLWLEKDGEYVFGPGAYAILQAIKETGTITEGARKLGMSYRYAWGVIRKIENKLDTKLLETYKGGTVGGGGANITEPGHLLMYRFAKYRDEFERVSESM